MSMDRSLKSKATLARHRNVLSRTERIKALQELERFKPGESKPTGLPKVGHRKPSVGGKVKKAKDEAAAGAVAAPAAAAPGKDAKKDAPKKDAGKKDSAKK